jgi:hypothetical protein
MKIERAHVIVTCPGRNFVTLKVVTNEGVYATSRANGTGVVCIWDLLQAPSESEVQRFRPDI